MSNIAHFFTQIFINGLSCEQLAQTKRKNVMKCASSAIQSPAAQNNQTQLLLSDVYVEHLIY